MLPYDCFAFVIRDKDYICEYIHTHIYMYVCTVLVLCMGTCSFTLLCLVLGSFTHLFLVLDIFAFFLFSCVESVCYWGNTKYHVPSVPLPPPPAI